MSSSIDSLTSYRHYTVEIKSHLIENALFIMFEYASLPNLKDKFDKFLILRPINQGNNYVNYGFLFEFLAKK